VQLEVPVFSQEHKWTCVPACLRMVLAFHGVSLSEQEIAEACGTVVLRGTQPEKAVEGLEKLGYQALWFENAELGRLINLIEQRWPVIVFLRASDLPYGKWGIHAAVIVGFEANQVVLADPVLGSLFPFPISKFEQAWRALGSQGLVIWKK
jgi:ABC-type bacteriocin/lantibiotic exporter with double-glycine peptidase domain